jgi:SAM-dependent methyltransferase
MNFIKSYITKISLFLNGTIASYLVDKNALHRKYLNQGRVPWSEGYSSYRNALIEGVLSNPSHMKCFTGEFNLPAGYGFKLDERCVEIPWVFSRFPQGALSVLDAGCAYFKFNSTRRRLNPEVKLTLLTLDKRDMTFPVFAKQVNRIEADMRNVPIEREIFDLVTCISTLEHVGMDNTQLYTADNDFRESKEDDYLFAVQELSNLLKLGGTLFITVPFGMHKNHGWLQVFDKDMIDKLISLPTLELVEESIFQHQTSGWVLANRESACQAIYYDVHADKTKTIDTNLAAAGAVACLWFKRI